MDKTPHQERLTAYDVAIVALHWLANVWSHSPGVSARLRRMADRFAEKAKRVKADPTYEDDDDKTPPVA